MKVFITGGTGFVGGEIVRQLVSAGHIVKALVRPGSDGKMAPRERVEIHHGDATDAASLAGALKGCDAVIHLIGIIREFPDRDITYQRLHVETTQNLLAAAEAQGVQRFLHMSSNGARKDGSTGYHRSKWQAEELVRSSDLDWTIFRPSIIFGPDCPFVVILAELIRRLPIVPVVGDGQYRMQPVALEQLAASFVTALKMPETIGEAYALGGGESYSYEKVIDLIAQAMGRNQPVKVHQPLFMVRPMVRVMELSDNSPLTLDQLTMLLEGNVCDPQAWAETFNLRPETFAVGIGRCVSKA